jgi:hypothetical protein
MDAASGSIAHADRRWQESAEHVALEHHAGERSPIPPPTGPVEPERRPPLHRGPGGSRGTKWGLAVVVGLLQVFVGLMGIWGGIMLITDAWALPREWRQHSSFSECYLPGLALLAFVGIACSVSGSITVANHSVARSLSTAAGVGLCAWIVVQIGWLRIVHPVMQPLILVIGLAIAVMARRLPSSR